MKRVLIVQEHLPEFRVGFYEVLRDYLAREDIHLDVVYAPNQRNTFVNGRLSWAKPVAIRWVKGLGWQPVLGLVRDYDLVIVQQELKYLVNPVLQLLRKLGGWKLAYWGHGKNFQAPNERSVSERVKGWLSTKVDWWFAYNRLSGEAVKNLGFPAERITEVMNSIDSRKLRSIRDRVSEAELCELKVELGIESENVAVFTGGLYRHKRLEFLLEAARLIKKEVPDFHLLVIGDGPDRDLIASAAIENNWIHELGAMNAEQKVPIWMLAKVQLMPGLVGLAIVDSLVLGVPLITTRDAPHSPEIDYMRSGKNGLMIAGANDVEIYAHAVAELLCDPSRLKTISREAEKDGERYSFEDMASRFVGGIKSALEL